ncbi:hypothetical protein CVO96_00490 [Deinococcus koreensis]|uniref:Glycosyl hydrolase family 98 putative carbohydrate-binding module domain-containing protein n=2 Tax=Deinococcus koreensis TaxID=2054903 RepID=A0A2K3UU19_9DEIO|nr:hypothetical protein CVO96_00490 [Deinococcus koreensis]
MAAAVPSGLHDLDTLPSLSASNSWGPIEKNLSNGEQGKGDGRPLSVGGETFARGLGMHAQGQIRYRLDGRCTSLTARVGIDDEVGNRGSAAFLVSGDGVRLFDSGLRRGGERALGLTVRLSGVRELTLTVTDGGDGIAYDHADWAAATLDCRVSPPPPAPSAFTYAAVAAQPDRVSEAQGEVVGGRLYVFGGFDSRKPCCTPTDRAQVYDPATDAWTPLPAVPGRGMTHAGMTTDGTDIFFAGGYVANSAWTAQVYGTRAVWRYNVAGRSYSRLPDLPVDTAAGQLEELNGDLHYFGGTNPERTRDLGDHYVLKAGTSAWTPAAPLPLPRHHLASAVVGGRIYAIGGQVGHDSKLVTQAAAHVYDPATDAWSALAPLPRARSHMGNSTFLLAGRIVVAGGETSHDVPMTDVTAYDPAKNTWTPMSPLPQARASGVAGAIGTGFVFTGGTSTATGWKATPTP